MVVDNCVDTSSGNDIRPPSSVESPPTPQQHCRQTAESTELLGPLDTGGVPLQLGDRPAPGDLTDAGELFSGCIKNVRINNEVIRSYCPFVSEGFD